MARYIFYLTILVGIAAYAFMLYRDRPPVDKTLFRDAEMYCLNQQWDQARGALIDVLRENPMHAGAHFYLGRAYMFGSDFRPVMAEGEFLTALNLFRRHDRESGIDRFAPKYFEMMCYIEAAKANLIQIDYHLSNGAPLEAVQSLVSESAFYADQAQQVNPDAPEVRDLKAIIDQMRPQVQEFQRRNPDNRIRSTPEVAV